MRSHPGKLAQLTGPAHLHVNSRYISLFTKLLEKDNLTITHNTNIQLSTIELFKVKNELSPYFMNKFFVEKADHCNLRKSTEFKRNNGKMVYNGNFKLFRT